MKTIIILLRLLLFLSSSVFDFDLALLLNFKGLSNTPVSRSSVLLIVILPLKILSTQKHISMNFFNVIYVFAAGFCVDSAGFKTFEASCFFCPSSSIVFIYVFHKFHLKENK